MTMMGFHLASTQPGVKLAKYEWSKPAGPAIVLLHGGGLSAAEWSDLAPALAATHHVVAFDARGCGATGADPERRYGAAMIASDLEDLRLDLGLEHFALVGHSFGAVAACLYAADHAENVTRLVLLDGGPADHVRPTFLANPPLSFTTRDDAARALSKLLPRGFPDWYLDSRFETLDDGTLTWRSDMRGRVQWSRESGEPLMPQLWSYVERLRMPTLVVHGAESTLFPLENAVKMAEINPRVRVVDIPEAGHFVHIDQPELVLAAIQGHLV